MVMGDRFEHGRDAEVEEEQQVFGRQQPAHVRQHGIVVTGGHCVSVALQ